MNLGTTNRFAFKPGFQTRDKGKGQYGIRGKKSWDGDEMVAFIVLPLRGNIT
jgi:hypothetical protein